MDRRPRVQGCWPFPAPFYTGQPYIPPVF
jgi:hypothetical protein